ncbi:M23 family metallopeptidase [Streptomyces sp. DT2A-34]|uniref:M23 family metallopeptidase n=1 Tax=Streptomyces sp. DT2A-34 TaxID=3051182 RepID=UPI00265C311D|nr:M23 family metallopeptidase [Streptomyces sp. DT2A-34]MDO0912761.1 M23 family metallopeptidase [Streptomyces sp. DT2A-34]
MSPRFSFRSSRASSIRNRAAVLAAGLGASVVLGAGGAVAAEMTTATGVSAAVQAQAAAKKAPAKKAVSWVSPVKKYTKSASFAQAGGMWQSTHSGQDFAVASGTQVVAAHGGTVVKAGGNGAGDGPAYGNAVVIKHGNGSYSQYAHLSRIDVKVGQVVKTGQHIAKSGNTGNSSGPHLHFEIRTTANYGTAVDPVAFLRAKGLKI